MTRIEHDPQVPPAIRVLLACPRCHGALADDSTTGELVCQACRLAFPVRDGIPVMLLDGARTLAT